MPAGTVDVSVSGEWSFAQTLRRNPWAPQHEVTVLACLHVILGEEWDHLRYALRDLDALAAG